VLHDTSVDAGALGDFVRVAVPVGVACVGVGWLAEGVGLREGEGDAELGCAVGVDDTAGVPNWLGVGSTIVLERVQAESETNVNAATKKARLLRAGRGAMSPSSTTIARGLGVL
jgi:hypothetical protein